MPFMNSLSTFLGRRLEVRDRGPSRKGSRTLVNTSRKSTVLDLGCSFTVCACDNLFFFAGSRGSLLTTALGLLGWFGHDPHPTPPGRNAYVVGHINHSNKSMFTSSSPITENSQLNHIVKFKVAAGIQKPIRTLGGSGEEALTVGHRAVP